MLWDKRKTEVGTLEVRLLQEDIDKGVRGSTFDCPIALALKRQFPDSDWSVGDTAIFQLTKNSPVASHVYDTPREARSFIISFDHGLQIAEPFSFVAKLDSAVEDFLGRP